MNQGFISFLCELSTSGGRNNLNAKAIWRTFEPNNNFMIEILVHLQICLVIVDVTHVDNLCHQLFILIKQLLVCK